MPLNNHAGDLSLRSLGGMFLTAAGLMGLDQWTKGWVRSHMALNSSWLPDSMAWMAPYARFTHIQNSGASFGMFQNGAPYLIVLTFIILAAAVYSVISSKMTNPWLLTAAGLYLGGAAGNLLDRLTIGSVTDFISIGTFYVFNMADAGINVSLAVFFLHLWLGERANPGLPSGKDVP